MKKLITISFLLCMYHSLTAQSSLPGSFSWKSRHGYHYLPDNARNQIIQGPCGVFAGVAAVEAMCQIYYNNPQNGLFDFSEAYVYNDGTYSNGCTGIGCTNSDAIGTLNLAIDSGFVNEGAFPYNGSCLIDCSVYNFEPNQKVYLPNVVSFQITLASDTSLKRAILNYGPIIMIPGANNGCALHSNPCNVNHTILITGWSESQWEIWDSWPGDPSFGLKTYSVFNYNPTFYRVYPVNPQNSNDSIRCVGLQNEYFIRKGLDEDHDGFYSWGLESYGRPPGCSGPNLPDWNDADPTIIFRTGGTIFSTPTVSGPNRICQTGGNRTFELSNVPSGFTSTWYISKNANCFNTYYGNGSQVDLYPNSSCIGKESEITFRITQNGDGGYAEYRKSFYINCPREDLMSCTVLDSYGGSPSKYGDTYYLCPYTTYNIFFNENDPNCSVSNLDWALPNGWSEHYRYGNYISVYTDESPDGFLDILGTPDCNSSEITLMSPYFAAAECGDYFIAYPNPSQSFVDIDIDKNRLISDKISMEGEFLITIIDKSGMIKLKSEFQGFPYRVDTATLPDGLYFINIIHKAKTSTIRLIIKHQ